MLLSILEKNLLSDKNHYKNTLSPLELFELGSSVNNFTFSLDKLIKGLSSATRKCVLDNGGAERPLTITHTMVKSILNFMPKAWTSRRKMR